jgi:hypothetical protein
VMRYHVCLSLSLVYLSILLSSFVVLTTLECMVLFGGRCDDGGCVGWLVVHGSHHFFLHTVLRMYKMTSQPTHLLHVYSSVCETRQPICCCMFVCGFMHGLPS